MVGATRAIAAALPVLIATTIAFAEPADRDAWQLDGDTATPRFAAGTEVIVKKRSSVWSKPNREHGHVVFKVRADARLHVIERGKKWLRVGDDHHRVGWIRMKRVMPATDEIVSDAATTGEPDELVETSPARHRARESFARDLELLAEASIGYSSYRRRFRSNGASALGGYRIAAPAMAASVRGLARKSLGTFSVAARVETLSTLGAPGIRLQGESGAPGAAQRFRQHALAVAAEVGMLVGQKRSTRLSAAVGFQLDYFLIEDVQDNPGLLAQEKLAGAFGGVAIDAALTSNVVVGAHGRLTPSASLSQTLNLEDGMESSTWAVAGGARARYALDEHLTIDVGLLGSRARTAFEGQSTRQFDVTTARRKDTQISLLVGAARAF